MRKFLAMMSMFFGFRSVPNANRVLLASGETVVGKVEGDHLEVETASGRLSVPYSSLKQLSATGDGAVKLELVDGTSLQGKAALDNVIVVQPLDERILPMHAIRTIEWSQPKH